LASKVGEGDNILEREKERKKERLLLVLLGKVFLKNFAGDLEAPFVHILVQGSVFHSLSDDVIFSTSA
jgi:hypothetical protein